MDKIASKLQYLKGLVKGMELNGIKNNPILDEIIDVLDLIYEELKSGNRNNFSYTLSDEQNDYNDYREETMQRGNYYKQSEMADVWYDGSLSVNQHAKNPIYGKKSNKDESSDEKVLLEKICKHCGTYIKAEFSPEEYSRVKIQCPRCKHFILTEETVFSWDEVPDSDTENSLETFESLKESISSLMADEENFDEDSETKTFDEILEDEVSQVVISELSEELAEQIQKSDEEDDKIDIDLFSNKKLDDSFIRYNIEDIENDDFEFEASLVEVEDEILFNDVDSNKEANKDKYTLEDKINNAFDLMNENRTREVQNLSNSVDTDGVNKDSVSTDTVNKDSVATDSVSENATVKVDNSSKKESIAKVESTPKTTSTPTVVSASKGANQNKSSIFKKLLKK